MLNIVVPMAGAGSRFAQAGYALPKPLIPVHGVPMIRLVIANLTPKQTHRFVFICQREHAARYDLVRKLTTWSGGGKVVLIDGLTEGAACTVLTGRDLIDNDQQLMIANSDQYIDVSIDDYLVKTASEDVGGLIMTMTASDPKWSFVGFDEMGRVSEVIEKRVISHEATVGVYNFRTGRDFVESADEMIRKNLRVNNEFYVAPVYNQMIAHGKKIEVMNIGSDETGMYGLGTPADLDRFLALPISRTATEGLA